MGIVHLVDRESGIEDGNDELGDHIVGVAPVSAPLVDIVHLAATEQCAIADGGKDGTADQQQGGNGFKCLDGLGTTKGHVATLVNHL